MNDHCFLFKYLLCLFHPLIYNTNTVIVTHIIEGQCPNPLPKINTQHLTHKQETSAKSSTTSL